MIRFSIVTISYNQAQFLPMAMMSVSRQIGPKDEQIIVDPGSSDDSRHLIAEHAFGDSRCRSLFDKDLGPADGLNKGFAMATGDVLAYINADDWLLTGALDFVRGHFAAHAATDVIIGAIKIAGEDGKLRWRGRVADYPTPTRLGAGECQYYQQGTFFRRTAFQQTKGFNPENRTCWDREIIVDLAIAGARFYVTSRPLGAFRIHGQSITGAGRNSASYAADLSRIQRKAAAVSGFTISAALLRWLKLEHRINPLRWLRQLYPVI